MNLRCGVIMFFANPASAVSDLASGINWSCQISVENSTSLPYSTARTTNAAAEYVRTNDLTEPALKTVHCVNSFARSDRAKTSITIVQMLLLA
ncbi:hypothetical protein BKA62DRAFT_687547 [Auriculariales sp. MPI-PUGE-AT-0066]|nr:hypothetical protein BKA62DRAFT_687547 [Auriculariales sp. MPI-PUGE-AT-0066]